jgi:hypothetical protein
MELIILVSFLRAYGSVNRMIWFDVLNFCIKVVKVTRQLL